MDTLRLTKPMMHGPAVKRLQEIGDQLGIDVGVNDGIFGEGTERLVRTLQERLDLTVDGVCGPATWAAILRAADASASPPMSSLVDRRGRHHHPRLYSGKQRLWGEISGVTLHQTGCAMPENPSAWDRLNAHVGVTARGTVIVVNDPTDFIWHAQGLSHKTIGIEIAGNFAGIEGDLSTVWKGSAGPHHLTARQEEGLERLFWWLKAAFSANGVPWTGVFAHRQSSKTRPGDPGSAVWQRVAFKWLRALAPEGTDGGPTWKSGDGRLIPKEWNPAYPTPYQS